MQFEGIANRGQIMQLAWFALVSRKFPFQYLGALSGVQDRCDAILEHLSAASCSAAIPRRLLSTRDAPPRLTISAALSLELILQQGLELGSHCPACWLHVFRTVRAVRRLEKAAFNCASGLDVAVAPPGVFAQEAVYQEDDE